MFVLFFFFKQKTAYEMRISDWSSDVCSSDLAPTQSELVVLAAESREELLQRARAALAHLQSASLPEVAKACSAYARGAQRLALIRSEERRVGKECVSTCRSRWSPYH